jgi:hypothetical protein
MYVFPGSDGLGPLCAAPDETKQVGAVIQDWLVRVYVWVNLDIHMYSVVRFPNTRFRNRVKTLVAPVSTASKACC